MYDTPEGNLWKAVAIQAMKDAVELDSAALRWLFRESPDFDRVMVYADMDGGYFRERVAAVVMLKAFSIARNKVPLVRKKHDKHVIEYIKPSKDRRKHAIRFLSSELADMVRKHYRMPSTEFEQRSLLEQALIAARL